MVMHVIRNSTIARGASAWDLAQRAWLTGRLPATPSKPLSDADVEKLKANPRLARELKSAVNPIQRGRRDVAKEREHALKAATRGTPSLSLFDRVKIAFDAMASDLRRVRSLYKDSIPEALKSVVKEHGGKTFSKEQKVPRPLLLAAIPKDKEDKDLSMKTLIKGIKETKAHLDAVRSTSNSRHRPTPKLLASENHIVLQRVINGREEVLEMTFRRAGKVDIYLNGSSKPVGSLWNDDALLTATAFLKGKDIFFHQRKKDVIQQKEYVICQKRSLLSGK